MTEEEKKAAEKIETERLAKEKADKLEQDTKLKESTVPYDKFKDINEKLKAANVKIEQAEKVKTEAEKKKLEDEGKYQEAAELAEKKSVEAEARAVKAEKNMTDKVIEFEIGLEAKNQGINDVKDATKLIDLTKVIVNDDGTITGVKEVVTDLKKNKVYLFDNKKIGVHTDHAKGAADMTKEELLNDPIAMTKLRKENKVEYDRILGK